MDYKEIWKDIPNYEGLYMASNLGRIKSLVNNKILKQNGDNYGYLQVILYKGSLRNTGKVHRLVALSFIENTENKKQVNHIDGNKHNNEISNLEWVTNKENKLHAIRNGITIIHEKTRIAQKEYRDKVILNTENGIFYKSTTEIGLMYNVNASTVRRWIQLNRKNLIRC